MTCSKRRLPAILAFAALALSAQTLPDSDRRQVLEVETNWNAALRRGDVAAVEALIAPDFELVVSPTLVIARETMLSSVANPGRVIAENGSRAQNVRTYGDTAVITGIYFERGTVGRRTYAFESRYTDVYVRRSGSWVAVSAHASQGPVTYGETP